MINKLRIDVARLPKYEKPFRQKAPFWLGSDGAFSLPLSRGRVLWLFGDTYVMPKTGGARREDADIINNAIGIQHGPLLARKDPFSFHCRWKGARPSAFFTSCAKKGFLWPLSAALNRGALEIFAPATRTIGGPPAYTWRSEPPSATTRSRSSSRRLSIAIIKNSIPYSFVILFPLRGKVLRRAC